MTDPELFSNLRSFLLTWLSANSLASVEVIQSQQEQRQGIPSGSFVSLFKVTERRYGWPRRADEWDADAQVMRYTERQLIETDIQVTVRRPQVPGDLIESTASDLAELLAMALSSRSAVDYWTGLGASLIRIPSVRQEFFLNDQDRRASDPSFDFTILHERVTITQAPVVDRFEAAIQRI